MAGEDSKAGDKALEVSGTSNLTHDLSDHKNVDKSEDTEDANSASAAASSAHHAMRTGFGWGRGVVADVRRTICQHWKQEMTNLNAKTIACSFFLYFACIAPAVTFGAIYGKATNNNIGAIEMIAATAWCGCVYALVGGQPMMINGGTGPVLAFSEIIYKLSVSMDVPFLTFNAWIGIWVAVYMMIAAFVDLNRIIVLCTRFTDEIFAFLIALIFIINAIGSPFSPVGVIHYFDFNHKSHDAYEDEDYYSHWASALLSVLVFLGTTALAFQLRKFKFSPFFPNQAFRNTITDFAVVISILVWSLVGNAFDEIPIEQLNVPSHFAPTYQCCDASCETNFPTECEGQTAAYGYRPWVVDLGNLNGKAWVPFMAAGPALLAFVLVFLDDGITWHLINHPSHKIKHGEAYNYDTIIIGLMVLVNSCFGLPWLVAATVRSLNHIHAMSEKNPDGTFLSVQETRLTGLFIHLLCFATIFAMDVLRLIPVPVLYGVFLFMGLVSLGTNQFWGRMLMFFMQPTKLPVQPYTQYMKPKRMHLFTLIQLLLFAALYAVKSIKAIAIAFPILIAACIPVRLYILPLIFTDDELVLIDSDPNTVTAWIANHEAEEDEKKVLVNDEDKDDGTTEDEPEAGDIEAAAPPKRRPRRSKTLSCPAGALMFTEESTILGPQLRPKVMVGKSSELFMLTGGAGNVEKSTHSSTSSTTLDELDLASSTPSPKKRRPTREERRANSAPTPNLLFGDVEIQNSSQTQGQRSGVFGGIVKRVKQSSKKKSPFLPTVDEVSHHSGSAHAPQ